MINVNAGSYYRNDNFWNVHVCSKSKGKLNIEHIQSNYDVETHALLSIRK